MWIFKKTEWALFVCRKDLNIVMKNGFGYNKQYLLAAVYVP